MRLSVAERSERGGRERNEDAVGFCANETLGCFVLADGTGGHKGGEVASDVVVQQVLTHFPAAPKGDIETIATLIDVARDALLEAREHHSQYPEMDTTIVTLVLDLEQERAYWGHLGDSRIYLFRCGRARVLTTDHSVLQSLMDAGFFTGALRGNIKRNMLYAAVGCEEMPERVVCEEPAVVRSGDVFLLCSDGFWEALREDIMEELLQQARTPDEWLESLVDAVPEPDAPGQDNFSALAIWVGEREEATTRIEPPRKPKNPKADA